MDKLYLHRDKELEYWRLRCQAAEAFIELTTADHTPQMADAYNNWIASKHVSPNSFNRHETAKEYLRQRGLKKETPTGQRETGITWGF